MIQQNRPLPKTSTVSRVIHVGRPNVLNREVFMRRVNEILDTKLFSNNGPFVEQLERAVCDQFGIAHCIAVSNATVGLEIALEALELKGKVIVPSFTFVASVHAISRLGLEPVFCDIDGSTGLIDLDHFEKLITSETAAVLPVSTYGNVGDVERLSSICKERGLRLLFDSAHALGVSLNGRFVGGFGDMEVFSLHATKFITGFEGGLITTNDDQLAGKLRLLRNFGFSGYDQVVSVGTNAKLSEIHAAMALTNFECIDEIIEQNKKIFQFYDQYLPKECKLIEFVPGLRPNYQYVVAIVPQEKRNTIVEHLHAHGVLARKYFYPGVHKFPPYNNNPVQLPKTDALAESVICFPTGQEMDKPTVEFICELVGEGLQR